MATKRLKKITQEEFESRIKEHFYYVHGGDESKRADFRNIDFSNLTFPQQTDLRGAIFDESDFSKINTPETNGGYQIGNKIYRSFCNGGDFRMASFRNVNFGEITLSGSSFTDAIFIGAKFNPLNNFQGFLDGIIVTEKELEQGKALIITEKREIDLMLVIFNEIRTKFLKEEILWLIFSFFIFLSIFSIAETLIASINIGLATIVLFSFFGGILFVGLMISWWDKTDINNSKDKWSGKNIFFSIVKSLGIIIISIGGSLLIMAAIQKWDTLLCKASQENSCLSVDKIELALLPLTLILLSLLWFSVHQYARAKKLRIEQQNKQAMIHYMQAVIAQDGKGAKESALMPQLAPFFANAIIHRPFSQDNYDPQLPIDEVKKVIDMAKLFQK